MSPLVLFALPMEDFILYYWDSLENWKQNYVWVLPVNTSVTGIKILVMKLEFVYCCFGVVIRWQWNNPGTKVLWFGRWMGCYMRGCLPGGLGWEVELEAERVSCLRVPAPPFSWSSGGITGGISGHCVFFMETFCLFPEMGICQTLNECRQSWQGGVTAQETKTQS